VGHILLISAQISSRSGPPVLQAALVTTLATLQHAAWTVVAGVSGAWEGYAYLRGVAAENRRLTDENRDLTLRLQEARADARSTGQLRALLGMHAHRTWTATGADVVAGSASPDYRSVVLDKGSQDGVQRDMPVLGTAGVVGRIVAVTGRTSVAQLLIDRNAAAAALVDRSRTQGIVLGNGDGTLRMEYLSATAEIQRGDEVVTAGTDRIYPKGLVIGIVERVDRSGPTYRAVIIRPVVDFSTLESVLIVLAPAPAAAADTGEVAR